MTVTMKTSMYIPPISSFLAVSALSSVRSDDNSGLNGQKPPLRPDELKSQAGNLAAQPLRCERHPKQTNVRFAEPKLQPKSRELEPQGSRYQESQSRESLLQATHLQESPSQESSPQATHPQESSSQESAPQESAPQESVPQESAPQELLIRESHLKQPDIRPAVSKLQSESKGSQASESQSIDQFVSSLLLYVDYMMEHMQAVFSSPCTRRRKVGHTQSVD
jgi:hypothetical protein